MLTLSAPAKINWSLRVKGKRDDGFHEIESLMQCISLSDTLTFELSDKAADTITLESNADIPQQDNLVYKAAILLQKETGTKKGALISLSKDIPIKAGLGGGSSDAAATLKGLCRLWGVDVQKDKLIGLGASLGSDVPFFIHCGGGGTIGSSGIVTGRGECVRAVNVDKEYHLVLVKPSFGVSAGWAYGNLGSFNMEDSGVDALIKALNAGKIDGISRLAGNDLESPVIRTHPVLAGIKESLKDSGAVLSLMSGSGSTVFGVFEDSESAEDAAQVLGEKCGPDCMVAKAETIPSGESG